MGIIEINHQSYQIYILSRIFLYGNEATSLIAQNIEFEINSMWNKPRALVWMNKMPYLVNFQVEVFLKKDITELEIKSNSDPRNNYIRIGEFVRGNISFVDGLGSNTGYFKLENLYEGSTTAAHEYGHTLGLPHPENTDYRGKGIPGIMYPRGTLVNPEFQYDPLANAGEKGGTLYPIHRKVTQRDIDDLGIVQIIELGGSILGNFSSKFHQAHLSNEV